MDLIHASASKLGQAIANREVSALEVTKAHLSRIGAVDDQVNAFVSLNSQIAIEQAQAVDAKLASGQKLGPLAGVPVAVKDLFCYDKLPTTASSKTLENWIPPYNSTVVNKLLSADMVILGKTNLDEFAMGSSTETSYFGSTHNPWDLDRIPGGSGGGSAAALAAFEAPLAMGTDTGGSIRQPAAVTGTVGVKPTYGQASRYGVIAMASSLDQPGPCARNVLDAALLHELIAGFDPMDSTSINTQVPDVVSAVNKRDIKGMKIGVVKELSGEGYEPGVESRFGEAVDLLTDLGAEVVEVSCPNFKYAFGAYYLIMPAEVSSNLARYDGVRYGNRVEGDNTEDMMRASRAADFGQEVKRRIIIGTYALSSGYYDAYYGSAQKVRTLIRQDFQRAFDKVDVLVSPATPYTAFKIGEKSQNPLAMYMSDLCTIPANLSGNPAGSFPIGLAPENGMPVGMQVIAPTLRDELCYQVGGALEIALNDRWGGSLLAQAPVLDPKQVIA